MGSRRSQEDPPHSHLKQYMFLRQLRRGTVMMRGHQKAVGKTEAHLHELGRLVRVGGKVVDGEAQGARCRLVPALHRSYL